MVQRRPKSDQAGPQISRDATFALLECTCSDLIQVYAVEWRRPETLTSAAPPPRGTRASNRGL